MRGGHRSADMPNDSRGRKRLSDVPTIHPERPSIAEMLAKLRTLPAPDEIEVRDADIIPERPGL